MNSRVGDDLSDRKSTPELVATVAGQMQAAGLIVDVSDPQALPPRILFGKAAGEELACRREAVELQRKFGTLIHEQITT